MSPSYTILMCLRSFQPHTLFNPLTPNDLKRRRGGSPLKIKIPSKICAKANKYTNYSFSLLIMYGSSYIFRHYIAIFRERSAHHVTTQNTPHPQYSIYCSSIEYLSEGTRNAP